MTTPAVLYTRFSPRPGAEDCLSIETQLERCRAQCAAKGWTVVAEHQDRELSGARADNRPGLQNALTDACNHKAVLVVYSLSRLARNTQDAIAIADRLAKCGADMYSLHESIDTTSAMGKFTFTLFAALAELERSQIGERTADAMQRHQSAGRRMSSIGRTPYGWVPDPNDDALMIEDHAEQRVLEQMKNWRSEGLSLRHIIEKLTEQGITFRGGKWHYKTIARILDREDVA